MRKRRILDLVSLLIAVLFVIYGALKISETKERVLREYLRHKEFLFLMGTVERKERADEESVRDLLKELGIEPEKVITTEVGIEVVVDTLSWRVIPGFIKELEGRFKLVSFEAVDNTGKGRFRVRFVVR